MKKRIACLVLALVMLVGLIPLSAVKASAAGYSVSSAGVRVIKDYVGFHKNAYKSGDSYKIGYGTPSRSDATITEANADKLLREELAKIAGEVSKALGGASLVSRYHIVKAGEACDGVLHLEERAGAGIALIAHHHSRPLAVAHGAGAGVGE